MELFTGMDSETPRAKIFERNGNYYWLFQSQGREVEGYSGTMMAAMEDIIKSAAERGMKL